MKEDPLSIFIHDCNANDVKTPKELYDAIEKFGAPRRYHTFFTEDFIPHIDRESAVEEAKAVYAHARQIAIQLLKSNSDLPPLPPPAEIDPFLGLQTISEWCISATDFGSAKQNDLTDTESNILEALGGSTLRGPELLKKAGYDNSSHYRAILSGLVKRNILDRNARGYHRK